MTEHHNVAIATVISLALPGAGQFYNGQGGKGALILVASTSLVGAALWNPGLTCPVAAPLLLLYIIAIVDAGVTAGRRIHGESVRPWQWF